MKKLIIAVTLLTSLLITTDLSASGCEQGKLIKDPITGEITREKMEIAGCKSPNVVLADNNMVLPEDNNYSLELANLFKNE